METDIGDIIFSLSADSSLCEQVVYTNRSYLECQDGLVSFAIVSQVNKMSTQFPYIWLLTNQVLGRCIPLDDPNSKM